jgi:hypothetical protein
MINTLEMGFLVLMVSFCFFFKKNQLGLLGTFIFVFYSGMMTYKSTITPSLSGLNGLYIYIFCGLLVVGSVMLEYKKQDQKVTSELTQNPKPITTTQTNS